MRTCFSKETKLPTDQSNICFLDEQQCVYRGRRVWWWNFLITVNEILDVSISFLDDHLEEALGSRKIEENHSKCINLTQVSVSSYFRTIDMSWLDFANHLLSNQGLHAWSWINRTFSWEWFVFIGVKFGFECFWPLVGNQRERATLGHGFLSFLVYLVTILYCSDIVWSKGLYAYFFYFLPILDREFSFFFFLLSPTLWLWIFFLFCFLPFFDWEFSFFFFCFLPRARIDILTLGQGLW